MTATMTSFTTTTPTSISATSTIPIKPKTITANTAQSLVTCTTSLTATKQLLQAALSCIVYVRGLFPEDNFSPSQLGDLQLKTLKKNHSSENTALLNMLEYGVFDALEKQYLRTMTLIIFQEMNQPYEILESYTFYVSYPENLPKISIVDQRGHQLDTSIDAAQTPMDLRKQTLKLIRSLVLMVQTLTDLPDHCYLSILLHYYDERTPENYEPKLFCPAPADAPNSPHFSLPIRVQAQVGELKSSFHRLQVELKSTADDLDDRLPSQADGSNPLVQSATKNDPTLKDMEVFHQNHIRHRLPSTLEIEEEMAKTDLDKEKATQETDTQVLSQDITLITETTSIQTDQLDWKNSEEEKSVACICGLDRSSSIGLLQCKRCYRWSHVVCYGFFHSKDSRLLSNQPLCHQCDPRGKNAEWIVELRQLALFRTCVSICWMMEQNNEAITDDQLMKIIRIPRKEIRRHIDRMIKEGIASRAMLSEIKDSREISMSENAFGRPQRTKITILKDQDPSKEAVRRYFDPSITHFPRIHKISSLSKNSSKDLSQHSVTSTNIWTAPDETDQLNRAIRSKSAINTQTHEAIPSDPRNLKGSEMVSELSEVERSSVGRYSSTNKRGRPLNVSENKRNSKRKSPSPVESNSAKKKQKQSTAVHPIPVI